MLGALLGLGGGVFLVPFLNIVLGLPFKVAAAISLMTVIATSSAVSARTAGRNLINLRLGMLLEVASAAGGLVAGMTLSPYLPSAVLYMVFAVVTALIAVDDAHAGWIGGTCSTPASIPAGWAAAVTTTRPGVKSCTGSSGCRSAMSVSLLGGLRLGRARHRRRHPESAGAQRVVRRADARGGGDERRS